MEAMLIYYTLFSPKTITYGDSIQLDNSNLYKLNDQDESSGATHNVKGSQTGFLKFSNFKQFDNPENSNITVGSTVTIKTMPNDAIVTYIDGRMLLSTNALKSPTCTLKLLYDNTVLYQESNSDISSSNSYGNLVPFVKYEKTLLKDFDWLSHIALEYTIKGNYSLNTSYSSNTVYEVLLLVGWEKRNNIYVGTSQPTIKLGTVEPKIYLGTTQIY